MAVGDSKGAFSPSWWGKVVGEGNWELQWGGGGSRAGGWTHCLASVGTGPGRERLSPQGALYGGVGMVIWTKACGNACWLWWGLFVSYPSG